MFIKKKLTIVITMLTTFVLLIKGIPFGNPVPFADLWVFIIRGIFLVSFAAIFAEPIIRAYKSLKKQLKV